MAKYSILTFIFGDYELLHEVLDVQTDVEYICVTDNKKLKSKTWKIVYDVIDPNYTPFRKVIEVRYNPFKYVHTDTCLIVDGSVQILKVPYRLLEYFVTNDYDLCTYTHPDRDNLIEELDIWKRCRNLTNENYQACIDFLNAIGYSHDYLGLYQVNTMLVRDTYAYNAFRQKCLTCNNTLATANDTFRVDQIVFSAILHKFFKHIVRFLPLSSKELRGDYLRSYSHASMEHLQHINIDMADKDFKMSFNNLKESVYIDNCNIQEADPKDVTVGICNYNTTELTNACIKSFMKYNHDLNAKIVVLDNSDRRKFSLDDDTSKMNVKVIDNTQGQFICFDKVVRRFGSKNSFNNHANLKHAYSIQFLMNICTTDVLVLMDSDVIVCNKLSFINDINKYVVIGQIETTNINMTTHDLMYERLLPFLCVFNMKRLRQNKLMYFDCRRIWFGNVQDCMHYDTGASFIADVLHTHERMHQISLFTYIRHLGGASERNKDITQFISENKMHITCNTMKD